MLTEPSARRIFTVVALATLLVLAPIGAATAQDDVPARVRHLEGTVTVQRAHAGETYAAIVNLPLDAGDRVWTEQDGRTELVLSDGSFVWLDASSTIDLISLPSAYDVDHVGILRLWAGSLIVHREAYDGQALAALRIDTHGGSAVLGGSGQHRIDIDQDQLTWLSVFDGQAELVSAGRSEPVYAGERAYVADGSAPGSAVAFNTADEDDFGYWQQGRISAVAETVRHTAARDYVPREVIHYAADLEQHGSWSNYDSYGWAWRPRVSASWSPYRDGRWVYGLGGWTWVPYSRWGYATTHYGRWHHMSSFGWVWFPGRRYSPARVKWYVGSGYLGWTPLNYYNQPCVSLTAFFGGYRTGYGYGRGFYESNRQSTGRAIAGRGYSDGLRNAWTFVPSDRLGAGDVGRVAVERTALPRLTDRNKVMIDGPLRPRNPQTLVVARPGQPDGGGVQRPSVARPLVPNGVRTSPNRGGRDVGTVAPARPASPTTARPTPNSPTSGGRARPQIALPSDERNLPVRPETGPRPARPASPRTGIRVVPRPAGPGKPSGPNLGNRPRTTTLRPALPNMGIQTPRPTATRPRAVPSRPSPSVPTRPNLRSRGTPRSGNGGAPPSSPTVTRRPTAPSRPTTSIYNRPSSPSRPTVSRPSSPSRPTMSRPSSPSRPTISRPSSPSRPTIRRPSSPSRPTIRRRPAPKSSSRPSKPKGS